MTHIIIATFVLVIALLEYIAWRLLRQSRVLRRKNEEITRKYAGVIDLEHEISTGKEKLKQINEERSEALTKQEELEKEVALLEENLEDISFGLYKPHFNFQTPDQYKDRLTAVRDKERDLIRKHTAAVCPTKWTVGDSAKEGTKMVKLYMKLMLRAFNGECDAAVATVGWNNIARMEERIRRSFNQINELGSVTHVSLTNEYLALKLDELRLTHEFEEKRYLEREEQRRVREQLRDEERARQEIERAREEAEREEADYEKALTKAREEALRTTGAQLEKLTERIRSLEGKVEEARQTKQRAIARAQLTKSRFVYVISNIGSFGERVFKIGMTRRLEPMDRIYELGDASVPFPFDLHVMLYSDNAPELEAALHEVVEDRAINLVNPRKEFYRNVDLDEIEAFVRKRGLSAQFIKIAEAREYRETLAIHQQWLGRELKSAA